MKNSEFRMEDSEFRKAYGRVDAPFKTQTQQRNKEIQAGQTRLF